MRLEVLILETFILVLMESGTKSHGKNLASWKILIKSVIAETIIMSVSINMVLNAQYFSDFGKIRVGLMIDPYGWFQWYFRYWLGRRSEDEERQINRWSKIVNRIRDQLVKWLTMLVVNLMITQFRLKLDIFCCTGAMN